MERKRRTRAAGLIHSVPKRFAAFFLAAAMVLTNVGTELKVSYAGTGEEVTFQMRGADLISAVNGAIMDGREVTAQDLDFTNGKIAEFEKMFFDGDSEGGSVYEIFPELDGGSMDAELRVFVRLPQDADDMYTVTGDEEILLLYVNNGSETISCNTEISRMDDGAEKVKKTRRVTVRSYEDAFGAEEVNIISKPVEETTAPDSEDSLLSGETQDTQTTVPDGSGSDTTASAPSGDGETDGTTEETTGTDITVPNISGTDAAGTDTTVPDVDTNETENPADADEGREDFPEPEKEKEEAETEKAEKPEPKETEEVTASITRHYAPVVADPENEDGEQAEDKKEAAKEAEEKETKEKETKEKETEAKETEPRETEGKDTESGETGAKETEPGNTEAKETEPAETSGKEEAAGSDSNLGDTSAGNGSGSTKDSDESKDISGTGEGGVSSDAADNPSQTGDASSTEVTAETQAPADTVEKARATDLVGIGYCSTAKVYTASINDLRALEDFDGYEVSYSIFPDASARIVEGPRGVNDGGEFSFGVKNQAGYEVQSVTINDEAVEADSMTDNEDGSQTAWYTVPEVWGAQSVEIYMLENLDHPAFDKSVEVNGVTIRITAPEGVLPADTDIQAEEITEQVAPAVTEMVSAEGDDMTSVSTVIAYDINLVYDGLKLDNSWASQDAGYVTVSFSGERIAQASRDADEVEILHLETPTETVEAVSAVAELEGNDENRTVAEIPVLDHLTAGDISVDNEGRQAVDVSGDSSVDEIGFTTDHFSAFTVVFKNAPHLLIEYELDESSTGTESAEYEVKLTPGTGRERFYYMTEDDKAVEAASEDIKSKADEEEGSIIYSFKLKAGEKIKIGNVSLNARYQASQIEDGTNQLLKVTVTETKLDWSEIESDSAVVTEKEVFPYGYSKAPGAYGSLLERAGALMRAYRKCREHDILYEENKRVERKRLLDGQTGGDNDNLRAKLLQDHYGSGGSWPLASGQGLEDVIVEAQKNLDIRQTNLPGNVKRVDLTDSRMSIYFRMETENPEDMEIIPFIVKNGTKGEQWCAYVVYNSADQCWYQYLEQKGGDKDYIGRGIANDFHQPNGSGSSLSLEQVMEKDDGGKNEAERSWFKLVPGEVSEPDYSGGSSVVDGSFIQSGDLRSITVHFLNHYPNNVSGGNTSNPDSNNQGGTSDGNNQTDVQPGDQPDQPDSKPETKPESQPDSKPETQPETQPAVDSSTSGGTSSGSSDGTTSGGSSGSGSGSIQNSDDQNGPGIRQVTITPEDVPLASLPVDAISQASQAMTLIDDGEVPLASLPKTGTRSDSAHELAFILSGILLAVYTALGNRKKKER